MIRVRQSRARRGRTWAGALLGIALIVAPGLLAAVPAAAGPTPLALSQRVAYYEDFSTGTLDPERWTLPSSWGLERARLKPWDFPALPLNDTTTLHLSDSLYMTGGRYAPANRTWAETNWIDLSAAASTAQLSLFHRFDIDPAEDVAVVLARSELRGWSVIAPVSGYPTLNGFAGSSLVFTGSVFDLSSYVGSRVKLAFELVSGTNGVTGDGWQMESLQVSYSTTASLPDFEATSLQLYDSQSGGLFGGSAGDPIELRLTVANGGTAQPPRLAPVVFYDGPVGTGRLLGRADLLPVAPGSTGTASIITVLGPGDHTLTAAVDPAGGTEELSTSNNVATARVTLEPASGVDLVPLEFRIEAVGVPTTGARPGDALVANVTVANLGSSGVVQPFTVGLYLRQSANTTALLQEQSVSVGIAAGDTRVVNLPFNAIAGVLTLVARVDSHDTVSELSEGNNEVERTFPVSATPGVDLTVSGTVVLRAGAPSTDAVAGELLQVQTTVHNAGTSDLTEPFTLSAYLGDPDAGGTLVWARRVAGGLLANQSFEVRGSWPAQIGVRVLYVYADTGREVFESNELNNKGSATVEVRPDNRVNLAVTDVSFTVFGKRVNQTQVGAPVNITVTVSNLGIETDVDGFLSMSPELPWVYPATTPLETRRLPTIIPRAGQAQITFPWTAASGTHVFYFVADYALTVGEANEFDNVAVRSLMVSPDSPDLTVGAVSVRSQNIEASALYPQLNVTIRSEVTNAGIRAVEEPFSIEVWAGAPGELGSVRLRQMTIDPPFVVGDSVSVQVVWLATFPTGGSHSIIIIADPNGTIVEADKTNNVAEKQVTYVASALPNLQLESVSGSRGGALVASAKEGDVIQVRLAIVNNSPVPFTAGTVVEARVGNSLVFSAPVTRMEPGQRVEYAFNWTAEPDVRLRVSFNVLGEVPEDDLSDNALDLPVQVTKTVETPVMLYAGVGAGAAAAVAVVVLLLVRRRRGRAGGEPDAEGEGEEAAEGADGAAAAEEALAGKEPAEGAPPEAAKAATGGQPVGAKEAPPALAAGAPHDAAEPAAEAPATEETAPAPPTSCPSCHEPVESDWKVCPNCEAVLQG